ncbi:MAG: hypothetical protein Q7J35_06950, partial [Candidatus Methanoperedens sp.]|nr:hypothetical protein [Candidatus Methanoperedens sp.]
MILKNIHGGQALRIASVIIMLFMLLSTLSYSAGADTSDNNSSENGTSYVLQVPFSKESIKDIMERESGKRAPSAGQRVIPLHKRPLPREIPGVLVSQINVTQEPPLPALAPSPSGSFSGLSDNGNVIPPDTMGAVGPSHLMEILNSEVGFFDKSTGSLITKLSLEAFWASLGTSAAGPFDPKVLYDQHSGRFITITLSGSSNRNSWLLIAVSETSDPTGIWYKWAIDADGGGRNWADYPGLGVDANNVYITANIFKDGALGTSYQFSKVWVIPKTQLLNGAGSITWTQFSDPAGSGFTMQPAHVFGASSAEYLVHEGYLINGPPLRRFLRISSITFPGGTPTWTDMGYVEVNAYPTAGLPDATQSGSANTIETNDERMLNAVYRNGYLWSVHTVSNSDNNRTEVAWYQIDPANARTVPPYGIITQQGRISDPQGFYYFPSIAVNSNNDVAIGFTGSSAGEYVSAYYTVRRSSDPQGAMQSVALLKEGLAPYYKTYGSGRNRWGDYSATVVDPTDDIAFWTLQEYASTPSGGYDMWGTWWGKFTTTVQTNAPYITSWINTMTSNNALTFSMNTGEAVRFSASANQTIDTWRWSRDGTVESSTSNFFDTSWNNEGVHNVSVNASNTNGTTQTIPWSVTVLGLSYLPSTPPSPVNLASSQANFWINHTRSSGPGNKTDSYNVSVNNSWTNGSINNYSNNSNLAPHGWSNITVMAYNNSGSLSAPVSNNTQVANNLPNQTITEGQIITLSGSQTFTFTGGHTVTFTGGHSITFTVNATDADFDPITYSTDAAKGSLNSITGVYSWATSILDVGTYIWSFRSSDTYGGIDSDLVTLNVVGPTYIPPTPSGLTPHQNNFWVNYTWSAGSGPNITNSYNVSHNTGWSNNTIPFRNNTVGPHGWSNISVYAYNNSGTGQMNMTPAIMNTQVNNNVPVLGPIEPRTVTVGQFLTFTISATDADSDTLTNATNASKGTFIPSTGVFTWTPGDSDVGTYLWSFNTSDMYGGVDSETITVTVNSAPVPPAIIGYAPPSPVIDSQGDTRVFNVTVSQTVNVTWFLNGTQVGFNESVTSANYTNTSAAVGIWNVSAVAVNEYGSAMQTWVWDVSNQGTIPSISFTDPTPADSAILNQNYADINTTALASSTALFDWNSSLAGWWRLNRETGESDTLAIDWSTWRNNGTIRNTNSGID